MLGNSAIGSASLATVSAIHILCYSRYSTTVTTQYAILPHKFIFIALYFVQIKRELSLSCKLYLTKRTLNSLCELIYGDVSDIIYLEMRAVHDLCNLSLNTRQSLKARGMDDSDEKAAAFHMVEPGIRLPQLRYGSTGPESANSPEKV